MLLSRGEYYVALYCNLHHNVVGWCVSNYSQSYVGYIESFSSLELSHTSDIQDRVAVNNTQLNDTKVALLMIITLSMPIPSIWTLSIVVHAPLWGQTLQSFII